MTTSKESTTIYSGPTETDKAAIAALPQRIAAAWEAHDAAAFAAVFTEDAVMILPGLYRKGRAEIRSFMAKAFEGPYRSTRVTGKPVDVRIFGTDSGVLITQGGVLAPGEVEVSAERVVRASWFVVKQDGEWLLAGYQNSPAYT